MPCRLPTAVMITRAVYADSMYDFLTPPPPSSAFSQRPITHPQSAGPAAWRPTLARWGHCRWRGVDDRVGTAGGGKARLIFLYACRGGSLPGCSGRSPRILVLFRCDRLRQHSLRPGQPECHRHRLEQSDSRRQFGTGLGEPASLGIQGAEAQVAVA
jgi:hypothetical protein